MLPEKFLDKVKDILTAKRGEYGDTYRDFGKVMKGMFPSPLLISSEEDWDLLGVHMMMVHKLMRQANLLMDPGAEPILEHTEDMAAYSALMGSLLSKQIAGPVDAVCGRPSMFTVGGPSVKLCNKPPGHLGPCSWDLDDDLPF